MSNKYMTGDIVKCKDVCSDPSYNGIECRLSTEKGDSNRWSNNSKNGNSLKEEDISHFIKRVDCNYKVGDVVKVKHFDTDMRHNIQLINGDMIKHKTVTITKVLGRDDFHTYQYKIEEDAYDWSDWMFEGLASECKENKQLSKEVPSSPNWMKEIAGRPTNKYGKKIRNVNRKKLLTEKDKELFTFKKKDYKIKRKKLSSEI